jgi:hypothetical protein
VVPFLAGAENSYGQNGKSTFLKYLERKTNIDENLNLELKHIFFDFSKRYKHTQKEFDITYYNRCCNFFETNFMSFSTSKITEYVKEVGDFILFIQDIRENLHEKGNNHGLSDFFGEYVDNIHEIVEKILIQNKKRLSNIAQKNHFRKKIRNFLKENEDKISPSDLFCFVIFYKIFQNQGFFKNNKGEFLTENSTNQTKRNKLVFVLDNIDDIKSHTAETIATHQTDFLTEYFSRFNHVIQSYISNNIPGLFLETDIVFIFSYRTANYLNSIFAYKNYLNQSVIERYAHAFLNADKYKISTVKSSFEIIQSRLNFYNEMCKYYERERDSNYYLLSTLLSTVSPDIVKYDKDFVVEELQTEINDLRNIFRLWNGNRKVLFNIVDYPHAIELFKSAELIPSENSYLRKGAFIFISLFLLHQKRNHTQLGRLIDYIFTSHGDNIVKNRASLLRLLLTYIISLHDSNENRKIVISEDVVNKGVSLSLVFRTLTKFKNNDGELLYKKNDFDRLFDFLFFEEIDEWSHLISCYKGTSFIDINGAEKAGKKFQFRKEVEKFFSDYDFENDCYKDSNTERFFESIRLYYNDNSKYLITHVIMHFEFYSFSVGNEKPLFLLNYNVINRRDSQIDFAFCEAIDKVFKRVERCIESNINFQIDSVSSFYTHNEFVLTSYLSLNNKFFFADLISKHITYLEQFRRCILEEKIQISTFLTGSIEAKQDLLKLANTKLTKVINNYLNLFFLNYNKLFELNNNIPESLEKTNGGFRILEKKVKLIIDSDYKDFKTSIKTNYNNKRYT